MSFSPTHGRYVMDAGGEPLALRVGLYLRRVLLLAGLVGALTGCGAIRFKRAWSAYEPAEGVQAELGMGGRWKGEWRSEWNGHSGGLRCLMTEEEVGSRYLAWFFSTYGGLFFFQYETVLEVTAVEGEALHFAGQQDLGKMVGGVYRYEGTVEGDQFRATFEAENGDHGVFVMSREN